MALRFFTRKRILPGVTLNMSKSGPSLSFGPRGFRHTIGRRGRRTTVGLPGSGLHYSVQHGKGAARDQSVDDSAPESPTPHSVNPNAAPDTLDRDFLRAVVAYQSGQRAEALGMLATLQEVADACWLAGVIELCDANWLAAVDHLNAALKNHADLGLLCDRNSVSIEIAYPITAEVTAHIGPDPRSTRLALVEAYQGAGNLRAALKRLKAMNRKTPGDLVVALSLAEIAIELEDGRRTAMPDLIAILDRADATDDLGWARDVMRARAQMRSGAPVDAAVSYAQAMADDHISDEMHKLAWYERALAFDAAGDATRCRQELAGLYAHDKSFADVKDRLSNRA